MNDITFLRLPDQAEDRQWAAEPPAHSLGGLARNTHRGVDASASERVSEPATHTSSKTRAPPAQNSCDMGAGRGEGERGEGAG